MYISHTAFENTAVWGVTWIFYGFTALKDIQDRPDQLS